MNCTPRSLKALEMPFLSQKLGFNSAIDDERITGNLDFGYNERVLVGNWLERRGTDNKDIPPGEMDLTTQYMTDYIPRSGARDENTVWDNRLRAQGSVQLKEGEVGEENMPSQMATVYDLAYRCRARDFVSGDYGSVTNYGMKECLRKYWQAQADTRGLRYHTEYKDSFSFSPCLGHAL